VSVNVYLGGGGYFNQGLEKEPWNTVGKKRWEGKIMQKRVQSTREKELSLV